MTDRFKGVLVTFDRDIRDDDAEIYLETIKMIKGVHSVEPYISGMEDYMMYRKGKIDLRESLMEWLLDNRDEKTPPQN